MSIETLYQKLIIENFLKNKNSNQEFSSLNTLKTELNDYLDTLDLTIPQFIANTYKVELNEVSSASKFNNTFNTIFDDLTVLYRAMLENGEIATSMYERYRTEIETIERKLLNLEDRIQNLLLLSRDTDGYFSYFIDNFNTNQWIDIDNTTAKLDTNNKTVSLEPDSNDVTKIFYEDVLPQDVTFKVRSTVDLIARTDNPSVTLSQIFSQQKNSWWTLINTKTNKPITCELWIKLGDENINLNKITLELNEPCRSSLLNITPLYSQDNYNYIQLPTVNYTQDIRAGCNFTFDTIEARYIKFLLTKTGPDYTQNNSFVFQFGFKDISFYNENFGLTEQVLISQPISINNVLTNEVKSFSKVTLETCERIETNTNIKYYIAASNDSDFAINTAIWHPIAPSQYTQTQYPQLVNLGDTEENTVYPSISYDIDGEDDYINPASTFNLLSNNNDIVEDEEIISILPRYVFTNSDERILNYQIKDSSYTGSGTGTGLIIDENNIRLFRNIGEKGLDGDLASSRVRNVVRGWVFQEPYYSCVIEILNPDGLAINFGDQEVIIDDKRYLGLVGNNVLTGTNTSNGLHSIKIHKNNFMLVPPSINSLTELKRYDTLYPYNHKLLIEGYLYGDFWSSNEEQVYIGVDTYAECLMKKLSIFDLINNNFDNKLKYYALDKDAPNSHTGGNSPTRVFVIKIDEAASDFQNEQFMLRFKQINQQFDYLRFKAVLSTESETLVPVLDSYKIKFG